MALNSEQRMAIALSAPAESRQPAVPQPQWSGTFLPERAAAVVRSRHGLFLLTLACLVSLYIGAYGWLLASTDSVPYVTDNNESFSAFFHGASLFEYGTGESRGLTDEAFSPDAAAHPYVYTHGENLPRAFTFIMYALGVRSVASQILLSTFTVGLLGLVLTFAFFRNLGGLRFAAIACLVLFSDYLFFAQWQVNTYRVWHTVLLFGPLFCVQRAVKLRLWMYVLLLLLAEVGLVLFDVAFAVFASVLLALFTLALYRHRRGLLAVTWATQGVGAAIALGVMAWQTIAYTGWSGFLFDLTSTYTIRNADQDGSSTGQDLLAGVQSFYSSHHIVFWWQFAGGATLPEPGYFLRELFSWTFQPVTPFFAVIIVVVTVSWALADVRGPAAISRVNLALFTRHARHPGVNWVLLGVPAWVAFTSVLRDTALSSVADSATGGLPVAASILAAGAAVVAVMSLTRLTTTTWTGAASLPRPRVLLAASIFAGTAALIGEQTALYQADLAGLGQLGAWIPGAVAPLLLMFVTTFGAALVIECPPMLCDRSVRAYLLCGLVAYAVCYTLLRGYVISDYLERMAPLTVYGRDVALAVTILVVGGVTGRVLRGASVSLQSSSQHLTAPVALAAGLAVLCSVIVVYWLNLQREYVTYLPPTQYDFLARLTQAPFHGTSFATNAYPAPIVAATDQWAYTDLGLASGKIALADAGYSIARDDRYLWMADRDTNPAYAQPAYFLCVAVQDLHTVVDQLSGRSPSGCSQLGVVNRARNIQAFPRDAVVESDTSGRDAWTIIKLDWDYPPFLTPLPDASASTAQTYVQVASEQVGQSLIVTPTFVTEQQQGLAAQPPLIRIYDGTTGCLVTGTADGSAPTLPSTFAANVRVSVTPRTATALGQEYFSDVVFVGNPTFILPNIQTGGLQQIQARSLEEAEGIAAAAGTWNVAAGTFGVQSVAVTPSNVTACKQ